MKRERGNKIWIVWTFLGVEVLKNGCEVYIFERVDYIRLMFHVFSCLVFSERKRDEEKLSG